MSTHRAEGGRNHLQRAIRRALQLAETLEGRDAIDALKVFDALRVRPRPPADKLADVMARRRQTTNVTPEPEKARLEEARKLLE